MEKQSFELLLWNKYDTDADDNGILILQFSG